MKRAARGLLFVACVVFGVSAFYNVFTDDPEVEKMAAAVACGGAACGAQKTREERTPIARTFGFVAGKRSVEVRCTRGLVLVGAYACAAR